MTPQPTTPAKLHHIRRYALTLAIIWTVVILVSVVWAYFNTQQAAIETAHIEARAAFQKDLLYRHWVSMHGGVYVPVTDENPPNPYLQVPNRDITTTDGQALTLVNPAYMTRQVHELAQGFYGTRSHITSLDPIRPGNAPDEWERVALLAFEAGAVEVSSIEMLDEQQVIRYMHAMTTESSCLTCHADQGYELGDIRGGISVSVPMQPYWDAQHIAYGGILMGHAAVWLLGLGSILVSSRWLQRGLRREEAAIQQLREAERRYRALFEQSNDAVFILDLEGNHQEANQRAAEMLGYTPDEMANLYYLDLVYPTEHGKSENVLRRLLAGESIPPYERIFRHKDGSPLPTEINIEVVRDANGQPMHFQSIVRDITGRKRMESALHESEEKVRSFIDQSRDGLVMIDEEGRIIQWNPAIAVLTGLPAQAALGQYLWDIQYQAAEDRLKRPEVCQQLRAAILNILQTGGKNVNPIHETIIKRPDGTQSFIQSILFPIRTEKGYRAGSILRDITEQKRMQEEIRRSEERYRSAIAASLDAFYLMESERDADGEIVDFRIVEANDNAVKQMGLPRETLVGGLICELFPINRTAGFFEQYKHVAETGEPLDQEFFIPEDHAAPGWYHHQVVKVGDGVASVTRDITERKRMEEALRESENRFKLILAGTQAGTWVWNIRTGETVFNERWAEMLGYTLAELSPTTIDTWLHRIHPDDLRRAQALLDRHFAGEIDFYECEIRMQHRDGRWIWMTDRGRVMEWTPDGEPLRMFGTHIDITERKEAEEALKEERGLFVAGPTVVFKWETAPGWPVSYISPNVTEQFGYDPQQFTSGDLMFSAIIHPDDVMMVAQDIEGHLQEGSQHFEQEYRICCADGTYRWIYDVTVIVYDEAGFPRYYQGYIHDITERKDMEEALRESEARLRAMFEALPDLVFRLREDGTYLDYHATNPDLLLMPPEQFMGRRIEDVVAEPLAGQQMAALRQAVATGRTVKFEYDAVTRQGTTRRFEVRFTPAAAGEVLCIARDVTELWRAQRDLKRANARLEFSVETARIAWWEMDVASGSVQFDDRKALMLGYDPQDFANATYHDFIGLVHPDDYEPMMQAMHDLLEGRAELYAADYRLWAADGKWMWFHDRGELGQTEDGRRVVRGFVIDITERMQVQQREIDLMLERERVSLLTSFMQNTAHEFRTPLSSIATSTYLMSRSEDTERRAEKAGQIEMQVQRITRLLDMLLTMVRVESDGELIRRPVQIEAVFEAICQDVQAYYGKQPALFCEHTKALPIVRGDAEYLSEALRHILDNAYRFTPPDGAITVSCGTEAGAVWLMVEDTGPGIAEEDLPHIFETFWRQDSAHSTPGFGLGLPIARRIIQQHGGEIMVESKAGQGTRVRVHLPVSEVSERSTLVS